MKTKSYQQVFNMLNSIHLFRGRIGTTRYLLGVAILMVALIILGVALLSVLVGDASPVVTFLIWLVGSILAIPLILFLLSLSARRLHDIGWSGWFALIMILPYINIGLFLILVFWEGQNETNKFGAKPSEKKVSFMYDILHIGLK